MINSLTNSDLLNKADEMKKSGNHSGAAEILSTLYDAEKSEDLAWRLISCLRHCGMKEQAWQILYESAELFPESQLINSQHGWLLYDFDLSAAKARKNHSQILEISQKILALKPDGTLEQLAVFSAADAAKALNMPEKILELLANLDRHSLDKSPREVNGSKILSWRERWFFASINALFELGKFDECRKLSLEAYQEFPGKFEYARKAALCLESVGELQTAADELVVITAGRKMPWYIFSDLARIQFENGQIEDAWQSACQAASAHGENKTKVNLFFLMARIMLTKGRREDAAIHAMLAAEVRRDQGWSVPDELNQMIAKLNFHGENISSDSLMRKAQRLWRPEPATSPGDTDPCDERFSGTILLNDSGMPFAFINSLNFKENVYVRMDDIPASLRHNSTAVSFSIEESFDKRKNRKSLRAIRVKAA